MCSLLLTEDEYHRLANSTIHDLLEKLEVAFLLFWYFVDLLGGFSVLYWILMILSYLNYYHAYVEFRNFCWSLTHWWRNPSSKFKFHLHIWGWLCPMLVVTNIRKLFVSTILPINVLLIFSLFCFSFSLEDRNMVI